MTNARFLSASSLGALVLALPGVALAQKTPTAAQCTADRTLAGCAATADARTTEDKATDDVILVTGSRIVRPNLESTVPITSIKGEEFFSTGSVAIGDVLNQLPALRSTFSQANSTRFLGTAGLNLLDLRGLGTQRTLVLVNGRRHVGSDILNNAVSPDTNTFPTDLIERVDVVTGGNSAVYGSDAIAGVVNFVLKQNYQGIQVRGQGGVSTYGDAGAYFGSVLAGTNFAEGRGNIAVNLEYAHQSQYFAAGRPIERDSRFLEIRTDAPNLPNNSDGVPDREFFRDIRSASFSNTGTIRFGGNSAGTPPTGLDCGPDGYGGLYSCPYTFNTDGTLSPITGTRVGLARNGSFIGGNGENFRSGTQYQLTPQLDRYNVNIIGHFDFSTALTFFVEGKYARTDSIGTGNSGPAFITGTTLGDSRERPRLDNPYLSDQARAVIIDQLTLVNFGVAPSATSRVSVRENLLGLGSRTEEAKRETYRGVLGVRGTFNDDWHYEASVNYGEFTERTKVLGNLNVQRFLLAADAVRDPASGNIVCNATINPAAAISYVDNDAILATDVAACTPINLFGGNFTDAQRRYLLSDTTSVGKITQFVGNATVTGDLSQVFSLPGGPIAFSIGAEYRRETNAFQADPLVEQGYTFYNALPTFRPTGFEVGEGFVEVRAPILKDVPFARELTLSGAGRVARYKGSTGTVYAYNGGVDYVPVQGLHFRANYARSVRAPNLVELYSAIGQNFATVVDPCSANNLNQGSSTRAANCAAAGIPTSYNFQYSGSLEIRSGGNPGLTAETSDSYTIGGVLEPKFIPGFSLSIDYYNIKVNKVISSVDAQTIIDQCYDQVSISNVFCNSFQRAGAGGGPNGEIQYQILEGSLLQSSLNFAKLQVRGIDFELNYRHQFDGIGKFNGRIQYTHVLQNDQFLNPTDPNRADQILLELGDPQDEVSLRTEFESGPFTLAYKLRYVGRQALDSIENIRSVQGRDPENADYASIDFYPSTIYHELRLGIDVNKKFNFYFGADNVLNTSPPYGLTGIGGGSAIYDNKGRFFYAGIEAKF